MYLVDTNIWLERLLAQEQAEQVGRFLEKVPPRELLITDFTLHSVGIVLTRLRHGEAFIRFVQDVLVDGAVGLASLGPEDMQKLLGVMQEYALDLDDAYQYVAAGTKGAVIVSLDGDLDRTPQGRKTPQLVLALAP